MCLQFSLSQNTNLLMHHQDRLLVPEVILCPITCLNFETLVFREYDTQESRQAPFHLARMPHLDQHSQQIYNIKHS
jgi:hypothetical protein